MKIIDLVNFFKNGGTFLEFCKLQSLNEDSEVIEIYMQKPLKLDSELSFFPIEETEGKVVFEKKGSVYHNLFDFYYFEDTVNDYLNGDLGEMTVTEFSEKLISYAVKDS